MDNIKDAAWPTDSHGNIMTWHSLTEAPGRLFPRGWRYKQTTYSATVTKAQLQVSLSHIARFQKVVAETTGFEMVIAFREKTGQTDPQKEAAIKKLRSVELCLLAHPDSEPGSEFDDRIDDLQEVIGFLKQSNA